MTLIKQIGSTDFAAATSASSVYAAMGALVLHLGLDRPTLNAKEMEEKRMKNKDEKVLIWGAGSSVGWYGVQIAAQVRIHPYHGAGHTTG